jgi:GxxExxY protein
MNTDKDKGDSESYAVIGAAMEVHRELFGGMNEPIYQDAMAVELTLRGIPFHREKVLPVFYKGGTLPTEYRVDYLCYKDLLVECKSVKALGPVEEAQVLNYLRVTRYERAVLLNFGNRVLEFKRYIRSNNEERGDANSADFQG